jgi:hypothetical protein
MISSADVFAVIAALDLDPIKVKLMHRESGEGWSLEQANAVELEYRRFLYLMKKFPEAGAAPRTDVDIFWHYHILDTAKYAEDCQAVFGHFLHHFPYVGLRGGHDLELHQRAGERMRELYESTFGEDFMRGAIARKGASDGASPTAYSWITGGTTPQARPMVATAYSWISPPTPWQTHPTLDTAYSWIVGPGAGGQSRPTLRAAPAPC